MIEIKICGITKVRDLESIISNDATWAGFIFYKRSIRNVKISNLKNFSAIAKNKVGKVALFVDTNHDFIENSVDLLQPDLIQLHGSESPSFCSFIKKLTGIPIMKTIQIKSKNELALSKKYIGIADKILFDAKTTEDKLNGKKGEAFDWSVLRKLDIETDWMLAGGLNPNNVQKAIKTTKTNAVDVSSGVERLPGNKCPDLINDFIKKANNIIL